MAEAAAQRVLGVFAKQPLPGAVKTRLAKDSSPDFAARVASRLPARRPVSLTPTHYGQNAMLAGIVVILAALVVLALRSTGHATLGLLESLLFAQFIALAVWFTVWRYGLR